VTALAEVIGPVNPAITNIKVLDLKVLNQNLRNLGIMVNIAFSRAIVHHQAVL